MPVVLWCAAYARVCVYLTPTPLTHTHTHARARVCVPVRVRVRACVVSSADVDFQRKGVQGGIED